MMRHYRIAMGLVCSSLGLSMALPAVAQQVVLTPGGTMIQPMPQAPVAATFFPGSITIDGAELKEQVFYPGVIAPGTGIVVEYKPGPVEVGTVTAVILDYDPDPLIGGPGGVRYSELAKLDKPDSSRTYTPEELAEAVRRGEMFSPLGFSAASPSAGNSLSPQFTSASTPESTVGTTSNMSSSIANPKLLNPPLLPSLSNASTSPLSTSRILPGFNR
jgi:hypothetical protein